MAQIKKEHICKRKRPSVALDLDFAEGTDILMTSLVAKCFEHSHCIWRRATVGIIRVVQCYLNFSLNKCSSAVQQLFIHKQVYRYQHCCHSCLLLPTESIVVIGKCIQAAVCTSHMLRFDIRLTLPSNNNVYITHMHPMVKERAAHSSLFREIML